MRILQTVAWVLVGLALMLFGADVMTSFEMGEVYLRSTADVATVFGIPMQEVPEDAAALARVFVNTPLFVLVGLPAFLMTLFLRPVT